LPELLDDSLEDITVDDSDDGQAVTSQGKTVPAERFNGLQRKLQATLAELDALKQSNSSPASEKETEVADTAQTEALNEALIELWRAKAVKKYPAVEALEDLLVGASQKDIMSLAEDLNSRLAPAPAESSTDAEAPKPEAAAGKAPSEEAQTPKQEMPVEGGAGGAVPQPNLDEEIRTARARGDLAEVMRLKYKQAGIEY
jgi:hypothetical protein